MQICKLYFAHTELVISMKEVIENVSLTRNEGSFNYLSCLQIAAAPQQPLAARRGRLRQILTSPLMMSPLTCIHTETHMYTETHRAGRIPGDVLNINHLEASPGQVRIGLGAAGGHRVHQQAAQPKGCPQRGGGAERFRCFQVRGSGKVKVSGYLLTSEISERRTRRIRRCQKTNLKIVPLKCAVTFRKCGCIRRDAKIPSL